LQDCYKNEGELFVRRCASYFAEQSQSVAVATTTSLKKSQLLRPAVKRFIVDALLSGAFAGIATRSVVVGLCAVLSFPAAYAIASLLRVRIRSSVYRWNGVEYICRQGNQEGTVRVPPKPLRLWLQCQQERLAELARGL